MALALALALVVPALALDLLPGPRSARNRRVIAQNHVIRWQTLLGGGIWMALSLFCHFGQNTVAWICHRYMPASQSSMVQGCVVVNLRCESGVAVIVRKAIILGK